MAPRSYGSTMRSISSAATPWLLGGSSHTRYPLNDTDIGTTHAGRTSRRIPGGSEPPSYSPPLPVSWPSSHPHRAPVGRHAFHRRPSAPDVCADEPPSRPALL